MSILCIQTAILLQGTLLGVLHVICRVACCSAGRVTSACFGLPLPDLLAQHDPAPPFFGGELFFRCASSCMQPPHLPIAMLAQEAMCGSLKGSVHGAPHVCQPFCNSFSQEP